jgi:hypothetical protein
VRPEHRRPVGQRRHHGRYCLASFDRDEARERLVFRDLPALRLLAPRELFDRRAEPFALDLRDVFAAARVPVLRRFAVLGPAVARRVPFFVDGDLRRVFSSSVVG